MKSLGQYLIVASFFISAIVLQGQPQNKWADSVLNQLKSDRQLPLVEKTRTCKKLLAAYETQKNYCKWIETAILIEAST